MWTEVDFNINKYFWAQKSLEIQQYLRFLNLNDLVSCYPKEVLIFGRTLYNLSVSGELERDHDDDVRLAFLQSEFDSSALKSKGFKLIRSLDGLESYERYGRYIDLHFGELAENENIVSGTCGYFSFDYSESDLASITIKYKHKPISLINSFTVSKLRNKFQNAYQYYKTDPVSFRQRFLSLLPKKIKSIFPKKPVCCLTEDAFLDLKIDIETAVNWQWRNMHTDLITDSGKYITVGEILKFLKEKGGIDYLKKTIIETPMDSCYAEPLHLNYDFWHSGNNFFAAPMIHGFRRMVVPYLDANLYIKYVGKPILYSSSYYLSLPAMSDNEIANFLKKNPISVASGAVNSGRHRVLTMVGRLLSGEQYIPFWVG